MARDMGTSLTFFMNSPGGGYIMHKNNYLRFFGVMCIILTFTFCSPVENISQDTGGDYDDLVQLFKDFRELQKIKITDWEPDYTPAAMEKQRRGLLNFQKKLQAIDISAWPIDQKVEYHLVRAEMNGLDFYQRVLKPWSRDPGFYLQTQDGAGPARAAHLNIHQMPIPDKDLDKVQGKLKALPAILKQAKTNLTEGAADLAYSAIWIQKSLITRCCEMLLPTTILPCFKMQRQPLQQLKNT